MTTVAQFEVKHLQYLDNHGEIQAPLPEFAKDRACLEHLYETMVLVRTFDRKAINLQRTGKMGTYAPITGQEAISTAIGYTMQKDDVLTPFYRDYAAQLQRGVKMEEIYAYWGGDERGSAFENNAEDFPISVPIASQCLHASGIATAFKYRHQKRVAVATIGDGGTSEGDFYEAINVAGAWQLPAVFVVNNNQWAISVPLAQQTACQTIAQKAIAGGIACLQVDGNDVIAMVEAMNTALERARNGQGATLIEALTYRLCDHTTADDASRYQPAEQVAIAEDKEPIRRLKQYLMSQQWWDETRDEALKETCKQKVNQAAKAYLETPAQDVGSLFDYHYAEFPAYLIEQRQMAVEENENA